MADTLGELEFIRIALTRTARMGLDLGAVYLRARRALCVVTLTHAHMDTILLVRVYASTSP